MKFDDLLTENEQRVLFFLIIFAFVGIFAKYSGIKAEEKVSQPDSIVFAVDYEIKYDLNLVTKEELITLPGIGAKKAADILAYRSEHGFKNKAELMNIKGIGIKTFAKLEKYFLDLGEAEPPAEFYPQLQTSSSEISADKKLNINEAALDDLTKLSGIGPVKAEMIIELRDQLGRFSSIDELLKVKGIGPKTLEKFKDQITIGDEK